MLKSNHKIKQSQKAVADSINIQWLNLYQIQEPKILRPSWKKISNIIYKYHIYKTTQMMITSERSSNHQGQCNRHIYMSKHLPSFNYGKVIKVIKRTEYPVLHNPITHDTGSMSSCCNNDCQIWRRVQITDAQRMTNVIYTYLVQSSDDHRDPGWEHCFKIAYNSTFSVFINPPFFSLPF